MLARRLAPVALTFAVACGSSRPPAKTADPRGAQAGAEAAPAPPPAPAPAIRRARLREVIAQGLGVFLQNVTLDDWPVMKGGKFHGFRLRAIHADWGVDLRPGDVITRINGMPIEHPEEADAALRSLDKASVLRIDYERGDAARVLEVPIVDDGALVPRSAAKR